jgi:hypothetical protein
MAHELNYPPIPELSREASFPPEESDTAVWGTSKRRLRLWAVADRQGWTGYVNDIPRHGLPDGDADDYWGYVPMGLNQEYKDGKPPAEYTLT